MPLDPSISQSPPAPLARLHRLARPRPQAERCDLCASAIAPEHQHLLDLKNRHLLCACEACAVLFSDTENPRYRRVPRRAQVLREFDPGGAFWESLDLPISLAFFYRSSEAGRIVAMYPSPAGATESSLPIDAWDELAAQSPALRRMQPDIEALLVNHVSGRRDCLIVSIDECYRLVGLIRANWRGLSGGSEAWRAIADFFDELYRRAAEPGGGARA